MHLFTNFNLEIHPYWVTLLSLNQISNLKEIRKKNKKTPTYTIKQLQELYARHQGFNPPIHIKKTALAHVNHAYTYFSYYAIRIQKNLRKMVIIQRNSLHGPAFINRKNCVNDSDYLTFEIINTLHPRQIMSYREKKEGQVDKWLTYIFKLSSFIQLISFSKNEGKNEVLNPYTRTPIPEEIIKNAIKAYDIHGEKINTKVGVKPTVGGIALELFQKLEHYSHHTWFTELSKMQLKRFIIELIDIWEYRAQLTIQLQKEIFPPNGNPFNINIRGIFSKSPTLKMVQMKILCILNSFVNGGALIHKELVKCYILGALTTVSQPAAIALPWLAQSILEE
jgi:hypothetical protein